MSELVAFLYLDIWAMSTAMCAWWFFVNTQTVFKDIVGITKPEAMVCSLVLGAMLGLIGPAGVLFCCLLVRRAKHEGEASA